MESKGPTRNLPRNLPRCHSEHKEERENDDDEDT